MSRFSGSIFLMLLVAMAMPVVSLAQEQVDVQGVTAQGAAGVSFTMEELQRLSDAQPLPTRVKIREEIPVRRKPVLNPASPLISQYSSTPSQFTDPVQHATQTLYSNFLGININESGSVPPDCMGSVGPTQVCVAANGRLKFYAKPTVCDAALTSSTTSGATSLTGPIYNVDLDVFFASVRNSSSTTDPHVHYDRLSDRWFIVCINIESTSNRVLIAVSNSGTITNASSFTFYYFNHDQGVGSGQNDYHQFCDYPMPGVDKNALYIGGLIFSAAGNFQGSSIYVVNKASITSGGPISFTAFRRVGTSSTGIFGPQGVDNDDPDATRGYMLGVNAASYGLLNYIVVNTPGATPTITTGTITVPATASPIDQVVLGSTKPVDGADDRILDAKIMKNKFTGTSTLWATHNIAVSSSGVATGTTNRNAVRWYELNVPGTSLTLKQSGTWYDNAASNYRGYWMGSIATNGQGHTLLGASAAGAANYANVVANGRYNSQTQGELSNTVEVTNYSAAYNAESDSPQRWGDYSMSEVDPSDNMTIWTFQEYATGTNNWGVRVAQFKAPPPATPATMTAITCSDTRTVNVTLTGTSVDNSGFFDPGTDANGPGFTKHLAVSSTGGVVISSVSVSSATQITFTLDYSSATLGSSQTLTITNPDCQSVTYNYTLPSGCVALPVKWLGISAKWVDADAKVEWKVASETGTRAYEIERSFDARNFTSIGNLNAVNNGIDALYSFNDSKAGNVNYYRIKQTALDGSITYSSIAVLTRNSINRMSVFPNPAKDVIQLLLPAATGQVRLLDMSGKQIMIENVNTNYINLPVEKLARGMYVVEYLNNGAIESEKVVLK